jgi:hypothetical protein
MARRLRYSGAETVRLSGNAAHGFAAGQALVHYDSGSVFTFIPKNACSTLRLSLAIANGCISDARDVDWIHRNNPTFVATLRELVTAPHSFVLLRCPYRRLASAFLDKIVGKTDEFRSLSQALDEDLDHDRLTFSQFVGFLSRRRVRHSNIHWRPQTDFLVYQDYDNWLQVEQMAEAAEVIEALCGLVLVDARAATGHGTDGLDIVASGDFSAVPCGVLAEMMQDGKAPSHAALYNATLHAAVTRLYADDLTLYTDHFGHADLMFDPNADLTERTVFA